MQFRLNLIHAVTPLVLLLGSVAIAAPALDVDVRDAAEDGNPAARLVVPDRIAFQGFLSDAGGFPVDGAVDLTLTLYDAAVAGASFWTEIQLGVTAAEGVFAVELGSVVALDPADFDGTPMWLGIRVFGGAELTPRTELLTAPFAFHALTADNAAEVLDDLTDVNAAAPSVGQVLQYNGVDWAPGTVATGNDGDWTISGTDLISAVSGNVGIGEASPAAKLDVEGGAGRAVRFTNSGTSTNFTMFVKNSLGTTARFETGVTAGGAPSIPVAINAVAGGTHGAAFISSVDGDGLLARVDGTGSAIVGWDFGGMGLAGEFDGDVDIRDDLAVGKTLTADSLVVTGGIDVQGGFGIVTADSLSVQGGYGIVSADSLFVLGRAKFAGTSLTAETIHTIGGATFDGNVGVGFPFPTEKFEVNGNAFARNGDLYAGQVNGVINCGGGIMNDLVNVIADSAPTLTFATGDEDLYIEDDLELGSQGYKPGGGSWATVSDVRLKKDIREFEDGLDEVLRIHPIWYRYNDQSSFADGREYVGVTAQDMLKVAPYMVEERPFGQIMREDALGKETVVDPGENYYSYDPSALVYMLVNAVQEQQAMLEAQQRRIDDLEARTAGR